MSNEVDRAEELLIRAREAAEEAASTLGSLEDSFYDYVNLDDILGIAEWDGATSLRRRDAKERLRNALEKLEALERLVEDVPEIEEYEG